jgi:hypothetical protein
MSLWLALLTVACAAEAPTDPPGAPGTPQALDPVGDVRDPPPADSGSPSEEPGGDDGVVVDTVYMALVSGLSEPTRAVLDSGEEWSAMWAQVGAVLAPLPDAPAVDLESTQVVVIGLGVRPSGGYAVELAGVQRAEASLTIAVREVTPGAGCVTTQALTQPVLVLAVPRSGDVFQFTEEKSARDCF